MTHLTISTQVPVAEADYPSREEAIGAAQDRLTVLYPPSVHLERICHELDARVRQRGPICVHSCDLRVTVTIE